MFARQNRHLPLSFGGCCENTVATYFANLTPACLGPLRAIVREHINLFMSNNSGSEIAIDFIFLHCYWHILSKNYTQVILGTVSEDVKDLSGKM